jgi:DNA processing protein
VAEQAAVLALIARTEQEWYRTAALIEEAGSALRIVHGDVEDLDWFDLDEVRALGERVTPDLLDGYARLIADLAAEQVTLHTVLDDTYPANLRQIFNRPPFLFVRGQLTEADDRAVAVVGTRQASDEGLAQTRQLAAELARRGVTVLSGLARGIDGAAHEGALDAGGRTVAVLGTGITRVYPPEHDRLAERVLGSGALVSQFWPTAPPTRTSFLIRNVVTSGMAVGTVVVEAHGRSGARAQARHCLEHGKRLFLVRSLVMQEPWAQRYAEHAGTTVVDSVDDIITGLTALVEPPTQLTLG